MGSSGFLFVGGCARSGTGALWTVVNADPSVALGVERYAHFVHDPQRFTPDLFEPDRFLDIQAGDTFYRSFEALGFEAYEMVVARYGTARWRGDKIPMLHPLYGRLARDFPGAKVLYILRNPFDVAASFQRRALDAEDDTWRALRDFRAACDEWNGSVRATRAWAGRLSMCVVDYESFFSGQADIPRLAAFLELEPERLQLGYETQLDPQRDSGQNDPLTRHARQYIARCADFAAYRDLLDLADRTRLPGWPPARLSPRDGRKYDAEDERVVDYRYHEAVAGRWFRGPATSHSPEPSIAFLGAASTFGRLVDEPYPSLVVRKLGATATNLGYGGARAPFYYADPRLLGLINECDCAVVEFFSARGTATPSIEPRHHDSAFIRLRGSEAEFEFADLFFARLLSKWTQDDLRALVDEIQQAYMHDMTALLARIEVPTVLMWFSRRPPALTLGFESVDDFMGEFPHFVSEAMVRALGAKADALVEVVTDVGIPNPLTDRHTGEPVPIFEWAKEPHMNFYYPSPLMHEAAAAALAEPLAALLPAKAVSRPSTRPMSV